MDLELAAVATAASVGAVTLASWSLRAARFVWLNFLTSPSLDKYRRAAGDWAIVTGGSDGIGRAFVEALAGRGFNVVIVSLDDAVLRRAQADIANAFPQRTIRSIGFNFNTSSDADYEHLFASIRQATNGGGISLLVNNVGINYRYPQYNETIPGGFEAAMIRVNCESQQRMSKFVLPHMKAKRGGAVVSMSSITATIPAALLASYSATKAYNAQFARAMAAECRGFGIDFIAVGPNFIATRMSRKKPGLLVNTPKELAVNTLSQLGKTSYTAGGPMQQTISAAYAALPEPLLQRAVFGANAGVMQAGLKADARRAAAKARSKL